MHSASRRATLGLAAVALILPLAACSGTTASTVTVTLQEWSVNLDKDSVPAGDVTFDVTNDGPHDPHELVVVKTDLAPGDLPTNEDGKVLEDGEGLTMIGEIEEFDVGGTESATFTLDAGDYVLICNIYDADEGEAHYMMGMYTAFTVE